MSEEIIERDNDYLITETKIYNKTRRELIFEVLHEQKTTGELRFQLVDGGIRAIQLSEKTKMSEPQRDKIRQILGME